MKRLVLLALAATATCQRFDPHRPKCPTVTSTASVCSTCAMPKCLAISTISSPCACPSLPTTTVSYPCGSKCPTGCMGTSYVLATPTTACGPRPTTTTTTTSVTPTPTPTMTSTIKACPTITSTVALCSTCVRPMCMALSTITSRCDCPGPVPTVLASFPCSGKCPGGCAGTSYVYATDVPDCGSSASSGCVPTVTVSAYPTSGCPFSCTTGGFCILDKFVTLPCGCTTADAVVTKTETGPCAATSPCTVCHTGFPFTTTQDCGTPTPRPYGAA